MKTIITLVFAFIFITTNGQSFAERFLDAPIEASCQQAKPVLNQIIYGATPDNFNDESPVLIFVHGWIDNGYGWFFIGNQMYDKAYKNGYQTTFLNQSQTGSLESNGQVVAGMIRQISSHFSNTKNIIIIAHSKGGLDSEYAMYKYGVDSLIKGVITLSTPFYGAPLADWGSSFLEPVLNNIPIFGQFFRDRGTKQLQTAFVQNRVRPFMDDNPNNHPEKFITLGGWGDKKITTLPLVVPADIATLWSYINPNCSELPFGPIYGGSISLLFNVTGLLTRASNLPFSEPIPGGRWFNDGLAPYGSSVRPGSQRALAPPGDPKSFFNHFDFLWGEAMWPLIQPNIDILSTGRISQSPSSKNSRNEQEVDVFYSNLSVYSDKLNLNEVTLYPGAELFVITSNATDAFLRLTSPNGKSKDLYEAGRNILTIANNEESTQTYKIQANTPYFGVMEDRTLTMQCNTNHHHLQLTKEQLFWQVSFDGILQENYEDIEVYAIIHPSMDRNGQSISGNDKYIKFKRINQTFIYEEINDLSEGFYVATIIGKGNVFNKVINFSFENTYKRTSSSKDFQVYPNVFSEGVSIVHLEGLREGSWIISLKDLSGKIILSDMLQSEGKVIDFIIQQQLPSGMFLLEAERNEERFVCKVVKP